MAQTADYFSAFRTWDLRSSVRSRESRNEPIAADELVPFPVSLAPMAGHSLVQRAAPASVRELLVRHLLRYLAFTVELEETCVMPVTSLIGRGAYDIEIPYEARRDAFRISTDEAYHSLFTFALMSDVVEATGVRAVRGNPSFTSKFGLARDGADNHLDALFAAIVSETLVSGILRELPRDESLWPRVRRTVRDHADDEGRHHAYFRSILGIVWPQLRPADRIRFGIRVPLMIDLFLTRDDSWAAACLGSLGLSQTEVCTVLEETAPTSADRRLAAQSTVAYFRDVGAFEIPQVEEAFLNGELLAPG